MSDWHEVTKQHPCPACGKPDWCAWSPDMITLKCERTTLPADGMRLVKARDGGALFKDRDGSGRAQPPTGKRAPPKVYATAHEAVQALEYFLGARSAWWTYTNAAGEAVGHIHRWDTPEGKEIRPVSRTPAGWSIVGMPEPRPLYRLPELAAAPVVYVCEGEKAAEAARALGLVATTSPHGSGSAEQADWSPLAGKDIRVLLDNDKEGRHYADTVHRMTARLDPVPTVRFVLLPGLPEHGDIVEFIQARRSAGLEDAAIRAEVEAMADAAPSVSSGGSVPGGSQDSWPEPQRLPIALPPVMPFDADLLPDAFRAWIVDIAERVQCPIDFPAVSAMTALAMVVGRKVGIRPKRHDDWTVVPNLWAAVIGRPGVMKTPAMQEPLRPLRHLEMVAKEEFDKGQQEHEASLLIKKVQGKAAETDIRKALKGRDAAEARRIAMETIEPDGEQPVRKRYIVNDSTVEKLGVLLNENPSGVLVFRDELIGLLRGLEKEGQEGARAFYLESWNGTGSYTYDRIGRGTLDIPAAITSILGGIQPGPLTHYLSEAAREGRGDDGFVQRFQLAVWPDVSRDWVNIDRWPDSDARKRAWTVFEGLDHLEPALLGADNDRNDPGGIPFLRFSEEAQPVFDAWRADLERKVRSGDLHPAIESHLAKYRSLIPSLALLIHLADTGGGPVGDVPLRKAIRWGAYLESHANRIYAQAIHPTVASAIQLAKRVLDGELHDGFSVRSVYRHGWSGLGYPEQVQAAADLLVDHGWIAPVTEPTGGRDKVTFSINPRLMDSEAARNLRTPPGGTAKGARRGGEGASGGSGTSVPEGPTDSGPWEGQA